VAPSGLTVYLKPGVNPDESRTRLLSAMSDERAVSVNTNHAVRTETFRIFDSTFAITWALELVAIVVAILGIAGTLLTLVLERERDFATLRAVGASRSQVRRIVVGEAVVIGAISQAIGIGVGLAISTILIYVVNVQSFGWTIQFHLPAAFLVQSSILVVLATAVAGLYPARRAVALATSRHE
jgi:putative ABC transport system permease protein